MLGIVLALVGAAEAGDLGGWEGQQWGSSKGGPKDPAAIGTVFPAGLGEAGTLFVTRSSTDAQFLAIKVANPSVVYLEGRLAGAIFMTDNPSVLSKVTDVMGAPFVSSGNRFFQNEHVSVWMQPYGGGWLTNVVSLPQRARCVELFGAACAMAQTRTDAERQAAGLAPGVRSEWDAAAEEHRRVQERALAIEKIRTAITRLCGIPGAEQECKDAMGALAILAANR